MGLIEVITRACVQTAVYWGTPVPDGYGGWTYTDAREIQCRWEHKIQTIQKNDGENLVSPIQVFALEMLDMKGLLFLGELADLDSNLAPPEDGAYSIKMIEKIPLLGSSSQFFYKMYLSWGPGWNA